MTRAIQKVVGEAEVRHAKALTAALADAQKKMAEQAANAPPDQRDTQVGLARPRAAQQASSHARPLWSCWRS